VTDGFAFLLDLDWEQAVRRFMMVLRDSPKDGWAALGYACALEVSGDSNGAIQQLRTLKDNPKISNLVEAELAYTHLQRQEYDLAEKAISTPVEKLDATRLLMLIAIKVETNRLEDVRSLLSTIKPSELEQFHFVAGALTHISVGGYTQEILRIVEGMDERPKLSNRFRHLLAGLYAATGDLESARREFEAVRNDRHYMTQAESALEHLSKTNTR
jgi:tetratricopeptide (TPR) repeat protein